MFCHQCGAGIDDPDDRFCSRCGAPLHHGEEAERAAPGPASPLAEPPADRHRRPISAWPDRRRERIQLPLTEPRQRRVREAGEPVPVPPGPPPAVAPLSAPVPPVAEPPAPPGIETVDVETVDPAGEPEDAPSTSRSRAEAALRRMVPSKDEWAVENQPGPAERTRVRDEWPAPGARVDVAEPVAPPVIAAPPVAPPPPPAAPPAVDDPIIPWLEPPVVPAPPERPAPPSREAKPDEGPIIVPREYDENAARQRKGRRRASRGRGPLLDPAALGRSIKPSWILAIAGVILLTLIVFAAFPPGGGDAANPDGVNRFTGMPVHTVATPVRPTAGTPAVAASTTGLQENRTVEAIATDTPPAAEPTASRRPLAFGALPGATTRPATLTTTTTDAATAAGASGIRVVVSSVGGWSGTIGQQAETYTETPVVGSGTQVRAITGPVTMITANIQKLDQTTDPLEVRVERDGVLLKRGLTTEPGGIVALSVQV
ncbi:MAG TPA: zinc ribbon domain-containing protein [Methanoregulaceae archaeon]|nr:zinc ribbon domain-containing protein [Methanoregulaceae archaeon]